MSYTQLGAAYDEVIAPSVPGQKVYQGPGALPQQAVTLPKHDFQHDPQAPLPVPQQDPHPLPYDPPHNPQAELLIPGQCELHVQHVPLQMRHR